MCGISPIKFWLALLLICFCARSVAAENTDENRAFGQRIADSPFVELYVLEELKQLRKDMAAQRVDLMQQVVDRELRSVDRGVEYATDAITYFFYLIAAASSVLVLVGWSSIREIKERVHSDADRQIAGLIETYERRLHLIENQLNDKAEAIEENREEIALTQEIHSLWLKAGQETSPHGKITIYDQILALQPKDTEALSYKADAVLELKEAQWAVNLCNQALAIDSDNSHALYQLACAYTAMNQFDDAVKYLIEAIQRSDVYRDELSTDPALEALRHFPPFQQLIESTV